MSPGGRILSRRGRPSPSFALTSREPLLFLYPRWATTAAAAAPPPTTTAHAGDGKAQITSGRTATGLVECSSTTTSNQKTAPPYYWKRPAVPLGNDEGKTELARAAHRLRVAQRRTMEKESVNRRRLEDYQALKAAERQAEIPDWREILKHLELHTPQRSSTWHDNALRIKVSPSAVNELLFGIANNMWELKTRTGCHIELSEAPEDEEEFRAVILSGPVSAMAKAAAVIMHISPRVRLDGIASSGYQQGFSTRGKDWTMVEERDTHEQTRKIRLVRSAARHRIAAPRRAEEVPRPTIWTRESFFAYVEHLTSIKMSPEMSSSLYGRGHGVQNHQESVRSILRQVFIEPEAKDAITLSAVDCAIDYLTKINQIKEVRELYVHLEMLGIRVHTETFNIMLRRAAKSNDLAAFHFIVNLLTKRGYIPNAGTWLAFLRSVPHLDVKKMILAGMKNKELLHEFATIKEAAQAFVPSEISEFLDREQSLLVFMQHMDFRYSKDWLSVSSANLVLKSLGERGLVSQCWDFIQIMLERDLKPNDVTINTVLAYSARMGNIKGAVNFLDKLSRSQSVTLNSNGYDTLFSLAWKTRNLNILTAVWRYACLHSNVTHKMRTKISDSIDNFLDNRMEPTTELSLKKQFARQAGFAVLGTSMPTLSTISPYLSPQLFAPKNGAAQKLNFELVPVVPESSETLSKQRKIQLRNTALIMNTSVFKDWVPKRQNFIDVLVEALEADEALNTYSTNGEHIGALEGDLPNEQKALLGNSSSPVVAITTEVSQSSSAAIDTGSEKATRSDKAIKPIPTTEDDPEHIDRPDYRSETFLPSGKVAIAIRPKGGYWHHRNMIWT